VVRTVAGDGSGGRGGEGEADGGRELRGGEVGRDLGSALVARPAGAVQPQHEAARRGRCLHPDAEEFGLLANQQRIRIVWDLVEASAGPDGSFAAFCLMGASTSDPMIGSPTPLECAVWRRNCMLLLWPASLTIILFYFISRQ
jgi:hypothetical protein